MFLEDLYNKIKNFTGQAGNVINQNVVQPVERFANQNVIQPVQREIQQAPIQFNNLENQVKNFGIKTINAPINFMQQNNSVVKPIQTPQFGQPASLSGLWQSIKNVPGDIPIKLQGANTWLNQQAFGIAELGMNDKELAASKAYRDQQGIRTEFNNPLEKQTGQTLDIAQWISPIADIKNTVFGIKAIAGTKDVGAILKTLESIGIKESAKTPKMVAELSEANTPEKVSSILDKFAKSNYETKYKSAMNSTHELLFPKAKDAAEEQLQKQAYKEIKLNRSKLVDIVRNSPEFKANPILTFNNGKLEFIGKTNQFRIVPEAIGLDSKKMQSGMRINVAGLKDEAGKLPQLGKLDTGNVVTDALNANKQRLKKEGWVDPVQNTLGNAEKPNNIKKFTITLDDGRKVDVSYERGAYGGVTDHFEYNGKATSNTGYRSDFVNGVIPEGQSIEEIAKARAEKFAQEENALLAKTKKGKSIKVKQNSGFKVGDVIDPQGNSNMGKSTIREIKGNTVHFTDENGQDYAGFSTATLKKLVEGGEWKHTPAQAGSELIGKKLTVEKDSLSNLPITDAKTGKSIKVKKPVEIPEGGLTKHDTPEIIKARIEQSKQVATNTINTPERQVMRENLIKHFENEGSYNPTTKKYSGKVNQGRQAHIVMGLPASGKSSVLVNPISEKIGARVLDNDMVKEFIPEFNGGRFAGAVHQESDDIMSKVMEKALVNGDNIVWPIIGKNPDKLNTYITHLKSLGYDVHVARVDLPVEKSAQRAITRFQETGRFVDPDYIINKVGLSEKQNYANLIKDKRIKSLTEYSNDVPKGEKPTLLRKHGEQFADTTRSGRNNYGRSNQGGGKSVGEKKQGGISQNTSEYLQKLRTDQSRAVLVNKGGVLQKAKGFLNDVKRKLVDSTAPIEDALFSAQKKGGYEVLPKYNIHDQIDRVIRTRELAAQFAKDNGLVDVIKGVPDMDALNQYLIAKHAPEVATMTGRNSQADAQLVRELAPVYEPFAQKVIQYGQKLLDYATQSGLVGSKTAADLKAKYPNYVPLNRIFNELEKNASSGFQQGVAHLGRQTVVQGLKGSERAIQNPLESMLTKTLDAFNQGERNIAGRQLASYKDLPGFEGLIRQVGEKENPAHTFSFIDNGVKKVFETTPEIAQAAKLLDKRQMGFIGKIFSFPVRIARVGITGLNIPFIASNIAKDQVTAAINSNKALQTSIANPKVFLKSLWSAVGHGAEYENWIRNAGGGTSFDISRSAPAVSIKQIRSGRNAVSKIAYTVTHPSELFRMAENIVARSEELTRLQQFTGTKNSLLKEGRTLADAEQLAARQSREATVNFARSGDWGRALNATLLYFNAGIQGSRTLVRNLATRPVATSAKIGLTVFTPLAAVTAWNLSDPERKAAYDDIRDFEKENNLILIPPSPTKDPETGKWNVIKIPYSQEVANLTVPVRKGIEAFQGYDAPGFMDFAKAIIGAGTSLNVNNPQQLAGQFTPQAVKTPMEMTLNKSTFTGNDIVPQYLNGQVSKNLPPEMQVRSNTSGTARKIGGVLGVSPMKVEYGVKSAMGGLGSQMLNASDQALAATGVIPKEQIGGQSIAQGLTSRFMEATGGQKLNNLFEGKTASTSAPKTIKVSQTGGAVQGAKADDPRIVENKGTYYATVGKDSIKSFDNIEEAQQALNKSDFEKSGKNFQVIDGMVYRKNKNGNIQAPIPENEYNEKLYTAKMASYKKNDDIKNWLKTAEKRYESIQEQMQDPTLDELEKTTLQNELDTLIDQYTKYKSYGGFTKPKKGKKGTAPKKISISFNKISTPKFTAPKISAPTSASLPKMTKIKAPKIKISKIQLKPSVSTIPGAKRLA